MFSALQYLLRNRVSVYRSLTDGWPGFIKLTVGSIGAFVLAACQSVAAEESRPNIVILFADDLGYADLGSYGNPYIRTPSLDRMAREGQRWTDFYVASPVCSPSRGALMTGQLSVRSGLYGRKLKVMFPGDSHGIPEALTTLPEALRPAGYATGIFGKWHLGDAPDNYPTRHGFDVWYGAPYSNDMNYEGFPDYDQLTRLAAGMETPEGGAPLDRTALQDFYRHLNNPKLEYFNVPLYRSVRTGGDYMDTLVERPLDQPHFTRNITEEAVHFIEDNRDRPFFVYVPYAMPHLPIFRSPEFEGKSLRGPYGDAVEEIDWSVGRIRETLEELDIDDNTLVIFSSDNGPWQAVSTANAGSAGMLRGSKGTTWEGGLRVPGIFWWPGQIESGVVSDIGTTLDVYATALKLAGVSLPAGTDGMDLTTTLTEGAAGPRQAFPYYLMGELAAFRLGRYKLYLYADGETRNPLETPELYDLREDIAEQVNLAERRPELLAKMRAAVAAHRESVTVAEPIFDQRLYRQSSRQPEEGEQ